MSNIAVVGATGAVGKELLSILEKSELKVDSLKLFASPKSAGQKVAFRDLTGVVEVLDEESFKDIDIAFFMTSNEMSLKWAPIAAQSGAIVIDNSSAYRMDNDVPLVVPEINPDAIKEYKAKNIIANPNCSTIQMVLPLKNIVTKFKMNRIVVSTYQSVSGAGQEGMQELSQQTLGIFSQKPLEKKVFTEQIAFNCIPQIGSFDENGYSGEEMKMVNETHKIFDNPNIQINATTVRVPVFNCHSLSVYIETATPLSLAALFAEMRNVPGVTLIDEANSEELTTPISCVGKDNVYVGRVRLDQFSQNAFSMWSVADNLRKGAALNAAQIAELLIGQYLES